MGDIAEDACLVVSELITNAVTSTREARLPDPVRLWMLGDNHGTGILVLIWDATKPAPVVRVTTPDAEHGRGLAIVDALSARWDWYYGCRPLGGKVVWAHVVSASARPVLTLPARPLLPSGKRQSRAPMSPLILTRVKAALERLPARPRESEDTP